MRALRGSKGHVCAWEGADQATCVQVSVKPRLTRSGLFPECATSRPRLTSARRSAAAALTSVHVPVICQLLQSRSCVPRGLRGSTKPSKGLKQRREYMLSLPEKAACQRFASHRRRRSVHLAMLSLLRLLLLPPPDEAGAAAKDAWLIAEMLRTKLLAAMSENLGF